MEWHAIYLAHCLFGFITFTVSPICIQLPAGIKKENVDQKKLKEKTTSLLTVCCLRRQTLPPLVLAAYYKVVRWFDRNPPASKYLAILSPIRPHKYLKHLPFEWRMQYPVFERNLRLELFVLFDFNGLILSNIYLEFTVFDVKFSRLTISCTVCA